MENPNNFRRRSASRLHSHGPAEGSKDFLTTVAGILHSLGPALPPTTEIVLHDLNRLPHSIVAIAGTLTERNIGDPPTDVLLRHLASGASGDLLGYPTYLPDGRQLLCSTIILRNDLSEAVGALCINNDVTHWTVLRRVADSALDAHHPLRALLDDTRALERSKNFPQDHEDIGAPVVALEGEWFARSIGELAHHMISRCIDDVDIPVDLMKKEHKLRVVADLEQQGMFLIRDAVETVASSLEVSRFTIYNYLNEIRAIDDPGADKQRAIRHTTQ